MAPVNELTISHLVVATEDGSIFASARDKNNLIYNFLITRYGDVLQQIGKGFESLKGELAESIHQRIVSDSSIRTYRVNSISI